MDGHLVDGAAEAHHHAAVAAVFLVAVEALVAVGVAGVGNNPTTYHSKMKLNDQTQI